ncbi:uncharacterized protein BDV14DRAFT_63821 [Aspergillus stella-maris]|uniref:uncharacterized protein n=1 Tax=Aspergillus stella-maris TaxID=1810926 RepID=UPI003CCDC209
MVNQPSSLELDPSHTSCIGGRTVLTCRNCAGNAPRTTKCGTCDGKGFNIFVCSHCNPAAAVNRHHSAATSASSTPASLSRSSSTTAAVYPNDTGRVENTTSNPRNK